MKKIFLCLSVLFFLSFSTTAQTLDAVSLEMKDMYEKTNNVTITNLELIRILQITEENLQIWLSVREYFDENINPYNRQNIDRIINAMELKLGQN